MSPGSSEPEPCAGGMYQNQEGQDSCEVCPEGYYCPSNTSNYETYPCPKGAFCPVSYHFITGVFSGFILS